MYNVYNVYVISKNISSNVKKIYKYWKNFYMLISIMVFQTLGRFCYKKGFSMHSFLNLL